MRDRYTIIRVDENDSENYAHLQRYHAKRAVTNHKNEFQIFKIYDTLVTYPDKILLLWDNEWHEFEIINYRGFGYDNWFYYPGYLGDIYPEKIKLVKLYEDLVSSELSELLANKTMWVKFWMIKQLGNDLTNDVSGIISKYSELLI